MLGGLYADKRTPNLIHKHREIIIKEMVGLFFSCLSWGLGNNPLCE